MFDTNLNNSSQKPFPSVRPSFVDVLTAVKEKLDFESFAADSAFYEDICKIVTEVLFLNPDNDIKVAGEVLSVALVQDIFGQLTHEHIEMVAENFAGVKKIINNKKAYLRTALYNSFFEMDAHWSNRVAHDMAEGAGK